MADEDPTLYNQITVKNIHSEDFVFRVHREIYMIKAGETRIFPKFMVRPLLKRLIDRILIKRNPEGKLLRNQKMRDELAEKIVLNEEVYERPKLPSTRELVDRMNKPELDRILEKNKAKLRTTTVESPKSVLARVKQSATQDVPPPAMAPIVAPEVEEETFDQLEEESEQSTMPTREQMLDYARKTLKLDPEEPTTKKAWEKMSDEELYEELGLNTEASEGIF